MAIAFKKSVPPSIFSVRQVITCTVMLGMVLSPAGAVVISPAAGVVRTDAALLATRCAPMEISSEALPARSVLAATTALAKPALRPHHRRRKSVPRKPTAKPGVKRRGKPVARTAHRTAGAYLLGTKIAPNNRPTLRKLTFASQLCDDLAPVMQAFGLEALTASGLGDAAVIVDDAITPPDMEFSEALAPPRSGRFESAYDVFPSPGLVSFVATPWVTGGASGLGDRQSTGGPGNGGVIGGIGTGGDTASNPPDSAVPSPAPEPASWVMFILGFGIAGTGLRQRRRSIQLNCTGQKGCNGHVAR